jgi:hypothetical protein
MTKYAKKLEIGKSYYFDDTQIGCGTYVGETSEGYAFNPINADDYDLSNDGLIRFSSNKMFIRMKSNEKTNL